MLISYHTGHVDCLVAIRDPVTVNNVATVSECENSPGLWCPPHSNSNESPCIKRKYWFKALMGVRHLIYSFAYHLLSPTSEKRMFSIKQSTSTFYQ